MRQAIDGTSSYMTGFIGLFVSINWEAAGSTIIMVGSIVLLSMRLYLEFSRIRDKWRGRETPHE